VVGARRATLVGILVAVPTANGAGAYGETTPPSTAPPIRAASAAIAPPTRAGGASTALVTVATNARARPGAGPVVARVNPATEWAREPQTLLVLASQQLGARQWLRVLLPIRPDGTSGWIPREDAELAHTRLWLELHRDSRMLLVYRNGALLHRFRAVIGKAATPTPIGLAAIYEVNRQPDPRGFLGPWALTLTALSKQLTDFGGGPGRIAIHGRDGASLADPLGSARSHGCIRIDNAPIRWLAANAAAGTPVEITR
jgi:L,D-transpeptidase catalytic domain